MNKYILLLAVILPSIFSACQNDSSSKTVKKAIDYKALSIAYCNCSTPSIELNKKALQYTDDTNAFMGLLTQIQKTFDQTIQCATEARSQYTATNIDAEKINQYLKKYCEDMPSKLRDALIEKVQ